MLNWVEEGRLPDYCSPGGVDALAVLEPTLVREIRGKFGTRPGNGRFIT